MQNKTPNVFDVGDELYRPALLPTYLEVMHDILFNWPEERAKRVTLMDLTLPKVELYTDREFHTATFMKAILTCAAKKNDLVLCRKTEQLLLRIALKFKQKF